MDWLLSKGVMDSHSFHKVFHSFPKVVPSERTSFATGVIIVDNIESAIRWEDIHPKWYLLIQVPN